MEWQCLRGHSRLTQLSRTQAAYALLKLSELHRHWCGWDVC